MTMIFIVNSMRYAIHRKKIMSHVQEQTIYIFGKQSTSSIVIIDLWQDLPPYLEKS